MSIAGCKLFLNPFFGLGLLSSGRQQSVVRTPFELNPTKRKKKEYVQTV